MLTADDYYKTTYISERGYMLVYKITNLTNNRCYIGATTRSLLERYSSKWCLKLLSNSELRNDVSRLGQNNFRIDILKRPRSKESLWRHESYFIKKHGTLYPDGYNFQSGGISGRKVHSETKIKISRSMKVSNLPHRGRCGKSLSLCITCGKEIYSYKNRGSLKKTCSNECFRSLQASRMLMTMIKKRVPVVGINSITGKKIYYESMKATEKDGFISQCVSFSLKNKTIHKGYYWRKNG